MPSGRSSTSSAAVSHRGPSPSERSYARQTLVLGAGALGLAWALTTTAAYLPPILEGYTSSTTLVGLVLATEGLFALTLPLVIGPWSDTFHTPLGRRRPFMLVALGPMAFALALLAFMPNLWTTALLLFALFFAYYVYEPPYRGLYPDLLPGVVFGRAQGVQHVFRGIAIGGALIGGGFLFHLWHPAPFLVAAAVVDRRLPRPDPLRDRGRRARPRVRGRPGVHRALVGGAALGPRRRDLPRGEHGLGGHLRGRAHVRRPLRHGRPRRAARHVDVHPGRRRRAGTSSPR